MKLTKPIVIEVCERTADYWKDQNNKEWPKYHAQIKGQPGAWAAGRSLTAAVGALICSHPKQFNITVKELGRKNQ